MEEKTYLKWYNKIGYGSGDIAGNVVYAFLTSFVMVYLTDTIGLASGIVGTLIAASKLFDGFTDVFFGSLIDKTHTKLGKARPWMIYGYIGCALTLVAVFAIPTSWGRTAQYAWFFIAYTLLNGVFYTANNIAYSALTSLVTKNSKERVQMGSYRFIFAFSTSLIIQSITVAFVDVCGGGAAAWRFVAIIYALIGLVVNTISGLSVKELPEEERYDGYLQLENGVGMLRLLEDEVAEELSKREGDDRHRHVTIATGKAAAPSLKKHMQKIREKYPNVQAEVVTIINYFFGESITVSGLITGKDLMEQLEGRDLGDCLLLPCNMLRSGKNVFLDDVTVEEVEERLKTPVQIIDEPGSDLVKAVVEENQETIHRRRTMYEQADCSNCGPAERG